MKKNRLIGGCAAFVACESGLVWSVAYAGDASYHMDTDLHNLESVTRSSLPTSMEKS